MSAAYERDGVRITIDAPAVLSADLHAKLDRAEAARRVRMSAASSRVYAEMEAQASAAVSGLLAARAARYASNMQLLLGHLADVGITGTGRMTAAELVRRIDAEIAAREDEPRRYVGLGGENTIINLKAARMCAEWLIEREAA